MDKKLKEVICESGNNLHLQVVDVLKSVKFENINLSCYYYDDALLKPREIDIIAKHKYKSHKSTDFDARKAFDVNLFIECKHFKEEIAYRPYAASPTERENAVLVNPFPLLKASKEDEKHLADTKYHIVRNSGLLYHHHFEKSEVGRLYDSANQDVLFTAITQPIKSYIFNLPFLPQGISYLIVVYEGIDGLYKVGKQDYTDTYLDSLQPEKISTLGVKYSYRDSRGEMNENVDFFIDFVHKDSFNEYLVKNVLWEAQSLADFILSCN